MPVRAAIMAGSRRGPSGQARTGTPGPCGGGLFWTVRESIVMMTGLHDSLVMKPMKLTAAVFATCSLFMAPFLSGGMTDQEYGHLVATLLPPQEEPGWLGIDWETDLWKARERAAREGKPIFLWEMDGHPLGCT